MHDRHEGLKTQGIHLQPDRWPNDLRTQTGQNIAVAVNGIAKLILMMLAADD
jgi:hypothetical protein